MGRRSIEYGRFKSHLREVRQARGLTLSEVAASLGVDESAVSHWERLKCFPTVELLFQLGMLYKTPIEQLWTYDAPRKPRGDQPAIPGTGDTDLDAGGTPVERAGGPEGSVAS